MNLTMTVSTLKARIRSIICWNKKTFCSTQIGDNNVFILLAAEDLEWWGVNWWGVLWSISLELHWFTDGGTGAEVAVGPSQLEMDPESLMSRGDERVAYLLCATLH